VSQLASVSFQWHDHAGLVVAILDLFSRVRVLREYLSYLNRPSNSCKPKLVIRAHPAFRHSIADISSKTTIAVSASITSLAVIVILVVGGLWLYKRRMRRRAVEEAERGELSDIRHLRSSSLGGSTQVRSNVFHEPERYVRDRS
jgi:hypothetical protein